MSEQESSFTRQLTGAKVWNRWVLYLVIFAGIAVLIDWNVQSMFEFTHRVETTPFLKTLFFPSLIWLCLVFGLTLFRTGAWLFYRPQKSLPYEQAPSMTVIIPAYNEGKMVLSSINSVLQAHYPPDKLEVFVIDDGSKDDTWNYIQEAAQQHPGQITALRFPVNQGKRAALAQGFSQGKGELFVTIDSDSVIDPGALLALAAPFRDPRVGAVAGKVSVYNQSQGALPRMLHTRFILTFDVMRAVESMYGTVYCTPGALSAYRAVGVRRVLDRWLKESFLGSTCTFGEDRALTNYLLSEGYDSRYQSSAVVHTIVPDTYKKMTKMFLRWDRSYVREEIRFLKIVWARPWGARLLAIFDRLTTNLKFPAGFIGLLGLILIASANPVYWGRSVLVLLSVAVLNSLYYLRSEPSWNGFLHSVGFSLYSTFTMWWIMPYAFFTVRAKGWLTR